MDPLDLDEVRMALKEMVVGMNNSSRNILMSAEDIKEGLMNMEENDEHFHKYNLIKMIQSSVEDTLGHLIDGELNQSGAGKDGGIEMIGPQLDVGGALDRIMDSSVYQNLLDQWSSNVQEAGRDLEQNFDAELLPSLLDGSNDVDVHDFTDQSGRNYSCLRTLGGQSKKTEILYSACDSPVDDSSSSQDTAMFLTNDSLVEIAAKLNKKNSIETRKSALRSLLMNTSVLDLPHAVWPPIREELFDVLLNFNGVLWLQALKIIARGLNCTSACCAKEMFQMLVEILMAQFSKPKKEDHRDDNVDDDVTPNDNDDDEINFAEGYGDKMLRAFRLLAQYVQQLSQKPAEKNTPDAFKGLILLLSKSRSSLLGLTPFQLLSLVNPTAVWFTRAMHGIHTRNLMLQLIGEDNHLLTHCVQQCQKYSSQHRDNPGIKNSPSINQSHLSPMRQQIEKQSTITSIIIVGGVIGSSNGRNLFSLPGRPTQDGKVSLLEVVITLIKILLSPLSHHEMNTSNPPIFNSTTSTSTTISPLFMPHGSTTHPSLVALDCLRNLCRTEEASKMCFCHNVIIEVVIEPLIHWMDDTSLQIKKLVRMQRSCDIIESLAFTESGRRFLISGWSDDDDASHPAPMKAIVNFISECLTLEPEVKGDQKVILRSILVSLLQMVRLIASSCSGVQVLVEHQLHHSIKAALAQTSREIENLATPIPGSLEVNLTDLVPQDNEKESLLEWEAILSGSLLSLLATPRGLGLVNEFGLLRDCLSHMCLKYDRKLQANDPNEKFSYWFVISQISTIPGGMMALSEAGFISLLIKSLWSALETNSDISPPSTISSDLRSDPNSGALLARPRTPCFVEKFSAKPFNSLLNVLYSFRCVSKLIADQQLPSKTSGGKFMPPQSLVGLFDRLVIVQTDVKIRSLYSYEQSHLFGLRLLNMLSCCLDTQLLIQSQYDVTKMLLLRQRENVTHENSKEIIIDGLSLMRNHILVRCYLIGGPNERLLPPKDLDYNSTKPIKLFCDYPVPECYLLKNYRKYGADSLLVVPSIKSQSSWMDFKKSVLDMLVANPSGIKDEIAMTILEQSLEYWVVRNGEVPGSDVINISSSVAKRFSFSKVQLEGMNLIIRYGKHLKLWNLSGKESTERLKMVVAKVTMALRKKFKMEGTGPTNSEHNGSGFDWFLASIFLITNGNANKTVRFLTRLSYLPLSVSYWAQHMSFVTLAANQTLTDQNIGAMTCSMNHNFEVIMQNELPQVYSAFKLSGLSPGQILQHWTRQCLLNYLDWPQIQQYLLTSICLGPDYSTYFCLALLRHLELDAKHQVNERNLTALLREEPIRNFHLDQHLPFMQAMEEKYRPIIIGELFTSLGQLKKLPHQ